MKIFFMLRLKYVLLFLLAMRIIVSPAQVLVYGPYLQQGNPNQMYVCWRTDSLRDSNVKYGTNRYNLNLQSAQSNSVTQHFVLLSALQPNTRYYYTIHSSGTSLSTDTFYFTTPPLYGSKQKLRFLAMGDCGSGYAEQAKVRDMLRYQIGSRYLNGILLLGDNAYESGTDQEYISNFFGPYQNRFFFPYSCIYPAPGNHDYANNGGWDHNIPYYSTFKTPQLAEAGGLASQHKEYYSYNYGNIHFVALDSYGTEPGTNYHLYDTLSNQYTWLKQDLAANTQDWTILYFHHPPYTMGTHNSDTETDLANLRQNMIGLLDRFGVDLVLNGHSHNYERSYLLNGHTGPESSFSKQLHCKDSSSAFYDGSSHSCPYVKNGPLAKGTVYAVAGAAGKNGYGQTNYPHDALPFSLSSGNGALYFEVENNKLQAWYYSADSTVKDRFTIYKNVNRKTSITSTVSPQVLSASWNGTYNWQGLNQFTPQISYSIGTSTAVYVSDSLNCLRDTFLILPVIGLPEQWLAEPPILFPNPAQQVLQIRFKDATNVKKIEISSLKGQTIYTQNQGFTPLTTLNTGLWPAGTYVLTVFHTGQLYRQRFTVE